MSEVQLEGTRFDVTLSPADGEGYFYQVRPIHHSGGRATYNATSPSGAAEAWANEYGSKYAPCYVRVLHHGANWRYKVAILLPQAQMREE